MKAKWIIKSVPINNCDVDGTYSGRIYYKVYRKRWYHFFSYGRVEGKEYSDDDFGFGANRLPTIEPFYFGTIREAEEYIRRKMATPSISGLNDAIVLEYE